MKFFKPSLSFGLFLLSFVFFPDNTYAYTNLLQNPGAENADMTGWTVHTNDGDGWSADGDHVAHSDTHSFSTSYGWDTRYQTIDLLAAGYTAEQLDSGTLRVAMSEWVTAHPDQGGFYYLRFELRAFNGLALATYKIGGQTVPITLKEGENWVRQFYVFPRVPVGTRYVYFEDGGRDESGWAGQYGPHFDDASVIVSDAPFYSLSYTSGDHGSLTGIPSQIVSGDSGSPVTAVPDEGYSFVDWSDGGKANPRTDAHVTGDIAVTARFESSDTVSPDTNPKPQSLFFSDVPTDHPYQSSISWAKEKNIVEGYPDGTFRPDANVNRAEFVKILLGMVPPQSSFSCDTTPFSDVPLDAWFTPFVCRAAQENIVNGYPDGTFHPEQMINFAEAAKVIVEALGISVDSDAEIWYQPYIQELKERKAIPSSVRANDQFITRGEMVYILDHLRN